LNYCFREPDKINKYKKYPLILFLHGAGGRGSNNFEQLYDAGGIDAFKKQSIFSIHQTYLLAPQVPENKKWVNIDWHSLEHEMPSKSETMKLTIELLDQVINDKSNKIDINRIYVLGLSMGGYGVWDLLQRRPEFFAAAVPICGGGDVSLCSSISHIPIWIWHGDHDEVINVNRSRSMFSELKKTGGDLKYSEIKGRGHDVWKDVWNSEELWHWIFSKKLIKKNKKN
jgi:predicted peptidase